ncbi:copper resistance protein [Escherichia coli]|nr:copper resistance protein [Escherichia coli]
MSIKNDGHYFCRAGGNRPDGLNEPVTIIPYTYSLIAPPHRGIHHASFF